MILIVPQHFLSSSNSPEHSLREIRSDEVSNQRGLMENEIIFFPEGKKYRRRMTIPILPSSTISTTRDVEMKDVKNHQEVPNVSFPNHLSSLTTLLSEPSLHHFSENNKKRVKSSFFVACIQKICYNIRNIENFISNIAPYAFSPLSHVTGSLSQKMAFFRVEYYRRVVFVE